MKKYIVFFAAFLFAANINAQLDLPRVSSKGTVTQNFGYTTVTIEYHRPSVKGRKIWNRVVPLNKVWRTGANEATTIQFSTEVNVNGNKVPAGKYSLFTIPSEEAWTVFLNKVDKQWGAYNYNEKEDLLRFKVSPHKSDFTETMLFTFSDITLNSAVVNFYWENVHFSFLLETDALSTAYRKMKEAMSSAKLEEWRIFSGSANFAAENNIYLNEALAWVDKSIEMGGNFFCYFVKAKILFKMKNLSESMNYIKLAREKGKDDKNFLNYKDEIDNLEKQIKEKS
jgi:hypothetical protein